LTTILRVFFAEFYSIEHAIQTSAVADCKERGLRDGTKKHPDHEHELEEDSIKKRVELK